MSSDRQACAQGSRREHESRGTYFFAHPPSTPLQWTYLGRIGKLLCEILRPLRVPLKSWSEARLSSSLKISEKESLPCAESEPRPAGKKPQLRSKQRGENRLRPTSAPPGGDGGGGGRGHVPSLLDYLQENSARSSHAPSSVCVASPPGPLVWKRQWDWDTHEGAGPARASPAVSPHSLASGRMAACSVPQSFSPTGSPASRGTSQFHEDSGSAARPRAMQTFSRGRKQGPGRLGGFDWPEGSGPRSTPRTPQWPRGHPESPA